MYFCSWLSFLGINLKLRHRVVSTACVYFRRFYLENNFCEFEPALVGATCLQLAAKVEESMHFKSDDLLRFVANASKGNQRIDSRWPQWTHYDKALISYCEFFVLHSLKSDLFVWPADQELALFLQDEPVRQFKEESWRILNDALLTDAPLLFPPHIIALACLFVAAHKEKEGEWAEWLAGLQVDLTQVGEAVQEVLGFYELTEGGSFEHECLGLAQAKLKPVPSPLRPPPSQGAPRNPD